ncbi:acetate/propionate family kinase [Dechloromonas sp. TW-R-39-2]|uniref:acetate/propionate family kinase n=1 Tax=Dechloromonas sp. TW-R-39-2 TaxID=2654218 RepID=UPI00193DF6CC|nr:acetate/propionate family kinase [Dechloromonas sp. TW-R-39-2]QRM20312.1 acetate/propionate family kinase [Dechloromonas sp. TW-R-39-2]
MNKGILTINAGSSSIKFALYELNGGLADKPTLSGQIDGIGASAKLIAKDPAGKHEIELKLSGEQEAQHQASLDFLLTWIQEHQTGTELVAVGHRVVHGGELFSAPMAVDRDTVAQLEQFITLAPLHQPHNLNGIKAIAKLLPQVRQVACFDTAFHRTNPPVAQAFAIPRALTAEGVKRYGFHGLSYEFIARVLPEHSSKANGRVIVAHLGNGSSMCAMLERKSITSTMGFTAIDGLMMGTRTGAIDPGVLLYLMDNKGMNSKDLTRLLYKESGLLGVSGISQDMRTLLASDQPEAEEAIELYCFRILREIGSLAAAIEGVDALVFTGGIGEHSAEVRRRVCSRLGWLGINLDEAANNDDKLRISTSDSTVDVMVIPTNEEWMIAHHAQTLLAL